MEVMGLLVGVAGLAGLFSTCLQVLDHIESFANFDSDTRHAITRFKSDKLLLRIWADAVGIVDGKLREKHHFLLDDAAIQAMVKEILLNICQIFDSAEGISKKLRPDLAYSISKAADSGDFCTSNFQKLAIAPAPKSKRNKIVWAIQGRSKFESQLETFGILVEKLYNLVPPPNRSNNDSQKVVKTNLQEILHGTHDDSKSVSDWLNDVRQGLPRALERLEAEDHKNTLRWLGALSSEDDYETHLLKRLGGTCDWIFGKPAYNNWAEDNTPRAKILWIHGPAGFGKTVLCASIAKHLKKTAGSPLAYFFCSSDLEAKRDPLAIVRSWVAQLVSQDDSAYQLTSELSRKAISPTATNSEVWQLFKSMASAIPLCTFIADGLDECSQTANSRTSFLDALRNSIKMSTSRILIVSRVEVDIQLSMSCISQETGCMLYEHGILEEDVQPDIDSFSRSVVDQKLPRKSEAFRADLADKMAEKCSGMFLWIRLQESQLRSGKNGRQLQQIVANMPTGLDRAYERDINMILNLEEFERIRAINILRFIMFALRPLTVQEITEALVVIDDDSCRTFPIDELPDAIDEEYIQDEISRFCGTLLQIREPEDGLSEGFGTVHFVHFSVKEYLLVKGGDLTIPVLSRFQINDENSQNEWFARICLRYLNFNEVWDYNEPGIKIGTTRLRSRPFVHYAAEFWHSHLYGHTDCSDATNAQIINFFRPGNPNWKNWQLVYDTITQMKDKDSELFSDDSGSPLYYVARFGFLNAVHCLHKEGADINATGGSHGNALQAAVSAGHYPIVKALLDLGANVNMLGGRFWSSLHASASTGDQYITELLLESGSNVCCQNFYGETPLQLASEKGHIHCVKLLLESRLNPNTQSYSGATPLGYAAINGHADVVRLLLSHGAEVDNPEFQGRTSLHIAAQRGHREVAELLLSHGAQVNARETGNMTPIHFALGNEHVKIVELLLNWGADTNVVGQNGWTCLHAAVNYQQKDLVELLLSEGADTNVANHGGFLPLHIAACHGNRDIVELLLNKGRGTGLAYDVPNGPAKRNTCSELLPGDMSLLAVDNKYRRLALHMAVDNQRADTVEILIRYGANPNIHDAFGTTSLDLAYHHQQIFSKLGNARQTYKPTEHHIRQAYLKKTVVRISGQTRLEHLEVLGRCLLLLGDTEAGCIVLEQLIEKKTEGIFHPAVCDSCDADISGNRYVCSVCHDTDVCERCMSSGLKDRVISGCTQHEFVKIPRCKEAFLTPGIVDNSGLTNSDWLKDVHARYKDDLAREDSELRGENTGSFT